MTMQIPAPAVLVVVAHPDDEVLGAGGTIQHHVAQGHKVHVVIVADNARTIGGAVRLPEATHEAAEILGITGFRFLNLRGMTLDTMREIELTQILAPAIEDAASRGEPFVAVYSHHDGDLNSDHRAVARAVRILFRPNPGAWPSTRRLLAVEIPSSTEFGSRPFFHPSVFVPMGEVALNAKLAAMACYSAEVREAPHPRSLTVLRARATTWGAAAGVRYAEPFILIHEVGLCSANTTGTTASTAATTSTRSGGS